MDGIGLAPAAAWNPFAREPTPALRALLGGPLTAERAGDGESVSLAALDACLGVEGLPQSVTGQASLFTGVNAARLVGRHVTGFLGPRLRELVEGESVFRRAAAAGARVTFANAFVDPPGALAARRRRASVTTCAAAAAKLPRRGLAQLARGEAVSWDVVRDRFRRLVGDAVAPVEPAEAGRHLARIAASHELTLFETFFTDLAGHRRAGATPSEALRRLDGLLAGALAARDPALTVVVTSDHGNLEDDRDTVHTRNPVPLLAVGPLAGRFAPLRSILDVTPRILESLAGGAPS